MSWESKVEKFDQRLALVRKQYGKASKEVQDTEEGRIRDLSLYEFYWKYYVHRGRIVEANQTWALMVTPSMPASSAQIFDDLSLIHI